MSQWVALVGTGVVTAVNDYAEDTGESWEYKIAPGTKCPVCNELLEDTNIRTAITPWTSELVLECCPNDVGVPMVWRKLTADEEARFEFVECEHCTQFRPQGEMVTGGGDENICPSCLPKFAPCEKCGKLFEEDRLGGERCTARETRWEPAEYEPLGYCPSCLKLVTEEREPDPDRDRYDN